MLSQEELLLKAVAADPDDDTVRLAFADWCAETDRPERSEFVRLQLARAGEIDPWGNAKLSPRELELLKQHAQDWFAPPAGWKYGQQYHPRRGFPWAVGVGAKELHENQAAVGRWPFTRLNVSYLYRPDEARLLSESPLLARVRELNLYYTSAGAAAFCVLAVEPNLAGLRWLDVGSCRLGDEVALFLAREPVLPNLRHLDLNNNDITDAGVRALIASDRRGSVESLRLANNQVTADDACALLEADRWAKLNTLCLWNVKVGDAGVGRLAACPALARLTGLNLNNNDITDAGVRALAASPHAGNLRALSLSVNDITGACADALIGSPHLRGLQQLRLKHTRIHWRKQRKLKEHFGTAVSFDTL